MNKGRIYVIIQFVCLLIIPFTGNLFLFNYIYVGLISLGVFIGLWAVVCMTKSRLNIFPNVKQGSKLIVSGPYKIVRHPMYTAIIIR